MVYDFTDQLTPDVQSAIPEAKEIVLNLISEWLNQENKQLEA
jgi:Ni,Fe-hydrogenase maturation factor